MQCNHKNLGFYKETNKVTLRQARWLSKLQAFNLLCEYTPGSKVIQANALSRRPDHVKDDEENDKEFYVLIPPEKIIAHIICSNDFFIRSMITSLEDRICSATKQDTFATKCTMLIQNGVTPIKSKLSDWQIEDNVIRFQNKLYIPLEDNLQADVVALVHNSNMTGHPG